MTPKVNSLLFVFNPKRKAIFVLTRYETVFSICTCYYANFSLMMYSITTLKCFELHPKFIYSSTLYQLEADQLELMGALFGESVAHPDCSIKGVLARARSDSRQSHPASGKDYKAACWRQVYSVFAFQSRIHCILVCLTDRPAHVMHSVIKQYSGRQFVTKLHSSGNAQGISA